MGSATYYKGNRVDSTCDHSPRTYEGLRQSWSAHFPALANIEWHYQWEGAIFSTTRFTPFFGRALRGRACYGMGFTGHGLGTTRVAGRIFAYHLARGEPTSAPWRIPLNIGRCSIAFSSVPRSP
jgi:glycine/D-amino acid oxidase-like deaminating enzyme